MSCNNETPVESGEIQDPIVYKGTISGSVYDVVTNLPIEGVQVFSDDIADSVFTDINGAFTFQGFEMADSVYEYILDFDSDNYEAGSTIVTARSGQEVVTEDVFLTPN